MKTKLKLLIIGFLPRRNKPFTGVQAVLYNFIQSIKSYNEFEIHIVDCFGYEKEDCYSKEGNINYYYIASPRPKYVSRVIRQIPKLNRLIVNIDPDIIHSHSMTIPALLVKCCRYLTVITPHSSFLKSISLRTGLKNKINATFYGFLEYLSLRNAKHIISISPYIVNIFSKMTNAKFYHIANPISRVLFDSNNNQESNLIIFVGKINPWKSPLHLLQAYNKIKHIAPNVQIKLIGNVADQKYVSKIIKYCQQHRLTNVDITGAMTFDKILEYYKHCLFLVHPSKQETASMAIAEAMGCSKPVIATNIIGNSWMVKNGETGFLYEYNDIDTLADKMVLLIKDSKLRNQMGKNARNNAFNLFHPDEVVKKTVALYKSLLLRQ